MALALSHSFEKGYWIQRDGHSWCQLKGFRFQWGQAVCLHNVRLHKQAGFGPVHIIAGRNSGNGEFWTILSDEPTNLQTFAQFGLRFDIKEGFLDDHSSGLNSQKSEIRSVCVLSRLWFVLAVATLYVTAQGTN